MKENQFVGKLFMGSCNPHCYRVKWLYNQPNVTAKFRFYDDVIVVKPATFLAWMDQCVIYHEQIEDGQVKLISHTTWVCGDIIFRTFPFYIFIKRDKMKEYKRVIPNSAPRYSSVYLI